MLLGVALGAVVFRSEPAGAQVSGYRECVFGAKHAVGIDDQGRWERADRGFADRIVRIPPGWELAGSGGSPGGGIMMICRR